MEIQLEDVKRAKSLVELKEMMELLAYQNALRIINVLRMFQRVQLQNLNAL